MVRLSDYMTVRVATASVGTTISSDYETTRSVA